jgi:O-antigen/teichoic acid export membrane protein
LASGTSSLIGLAAPLLTFFFATPFLVHRLGAGTYGALMLCLSITSLLGSLDFGLSAGGVRAQGNALHHSDTSAVIRLHQELWSLFLYLGLALMTIVWIASPQIVRLIEMDQAATPSEAVIAVRIASVSLLIALLTAAVSILPRALEQFPSIVMIQVVSGIAFWGGAVALVISGYGLIAVLLWGLAVSSLVLIRFIAWSDRLVPHLKWRPCLHLYMTKTLIGYSLYAFFGQLSSAFTYHADKFLIAYFLGPAPVAYYAVAVNVANKLLSLVASLTAFVFPRAVRFHAASDLAAIREFYLRASRFTLLVLVPLLAPAVILAPQLLKLWLGEEFARVANSLLQVLLVAYAIGALSVVPSQIYNAMGNSRVGAIFAGTGAVLNVALCVVLIPWLGVKGAAIASLVGMLQAIVYVVLLERSLGLDWLSRPMGFFGRLAVVVGVQAGLLFVLRGWISGWMGLLIVGGLGWTLFYGLWFLARFADREDYEMANRLLLRWRKLRYWS